MAALKRLTSPSSDTGADKIFGANWNDLYDSLVGDNTNAITIGGTFTAKGAFRVNNPADTFYYDITPAAIAANRTLNLPLLTGTDTIAVLDLAQTFTNKTMSGASNTFSNIAYASLVLTNSIVDGDIAASGITTRSKLPSAIAYEDEANTFTQSLTIQADTILLGATATSGAQLKDSQALTLRGNYWNGSASVSRDAQMLHTVDAVTPTSLLDFSIGGTRRFRITDTGMIVAEGGIRADISQQRNTLDGAWYILGPPTADINISSLADGSTAREINMATPGSTATGTANIVNRFNIRAGAVQGSAIINVFESMTFPVTTSFPGTDATYPGIGRNSSGDLVLRGATSKGVHLGAYPLKVTNISAQDGTASMTLADTTGNVDANSKTWTNFVASGPAINGTVTTTGLTLPAFTLDGTITGAGNGFVGLGPSSFNNTAALKWKDSGGTDRDIMFLFSDNKLYIDNAAGGDIVIRRGGTDKVTIGASDITLADTQNIAVNTATGTKIGTATTQKIGFYNATPIVQGAAVADASGGATVDTEARTAINTLLARIRATGLIAT